MSAPFLKDQDRTSFAHARRADLPGRDGEDDRASGAAQAAFDRARSMEAASLRRAGSAERRDEQDAPARPNGFVFPQPHPSFAHPTRLPEAELFRAGANDAPGDRMDKRAFVAMRRAVFDQERMRDKPQRRER